MSIFRISSLRLASASSLHLQNLYQPRYFCLTAQPQFKVRSKSSPKTDQEQGTTAAMATSPSVDNVQSPSTPEVKPHAPSESNPPIPKKSIKEQIILFYKNMWRDYREVFKDAYIEGKQKPWKTVVYSVIFGTMGYLIWSNPTEADFDEECYQNRTKLALVGNPIRNPTSVAHCNFVEKLRIKGELRYQSLGLFSVVWRHDNSEAVGAISATCSYLKPRLREAPERIVDIGFGNRWWIGADRMKDYDVNSREWEIADLLKAQRIFEQQQQQQQKEEVV